MTLPGTIYLIDTSALARDRHPVVHKRITRLIENGVAATCATIDLEVGYSARSIDTMRSVAAARRELFVNLPITQQIMEQSLATQELLAGHGLHRAAGAMDLITAAVAARYRATIVHYDADFEHIASVTGLEQQWIVPRGSID